MSVYIQYHNVANEGLLLDAPPFSRTKLGIYTRPAHAQNAQGRVFLIAGLGKPRRFYLWSTFEIEQVRRNSDGSYQLAGTGWQLAPPQELTGERFHAFQAACANFVGFRCIDELPFKKTLAKLANKHRPPGDGRERTNFFRRLRWLLRHDETSLGQVDQIVGDLPSKALSIRQPWAWLIANGYKKIENRTWDTSYRGDFLIHAGQKVDDDGYDWVKSTFPRIRVPKKEALERGGIVGKARLDDVVEDHASPWFFGPYGFLLAKAEPVDFVAMVGALGFFEV